MARARMLFLATHPKEAASTRYRVLAYHPALQREDIAVDFHPFFPSEVLGTIYAERRWHLKSLWILRKTWERWCQLHAREYDIVFIHRELFPWGMGLGMALFVPALKCLRSRLMYDFDDAVYLPHRSDRGWVSRFENPQSVYELLRMSHRVIAGNSYLAEHAGRLNRSVRCIPTPVDTERYFPSTNDGVTRPPTIGWIGTPSTAKFLRGLMPVFERLARTHRFQLKIMGTGHLALPQGVMVDHRSWSLQTEAEEFRTCDIGVYPLWDDEWSRGKCGFKALQFMASGVPVVASAIGMNTQIIQHECNGLLARSADDWHAHLVRLLEDAELRHQLGHAGRDTIEREYSLERLAPVFIETVQSVLQEQSHAGDRAARIAPPGSAASAASVSALAVATERQNVLCFSSIDWDFVWQGHQEIMTTLARAGHRVLFVENTGVRNAGLRDLPRMRQRLTNWCQSLQGFRQVAENLYVFSPLVLPFPYARVARWINRHLLVSALRQWMAAMEFYQPICWTFLPTPIVLEVIQRIPHKALIYYCIDSFANSTSAARRIVDSEQALLQQADLVFVTSRSLQEHAARWSRQVHLFPFGVSLAAFPHAEAAPGDDLPDELRGLPRPVIGYVGGIHQWVDQALLCALARSRRHYALVVVGPQQTNIEALRQEPNIHLIGQKPHDQLARYIREFDVGLIPYRLTEYTSNVYPTKLNEYHVMGIPVVSTPLPEVLAFNRQHQGLVTIGTSETSFCEAVDRALRDNAPAARSRRVAAAQENAWDRRINTMQQLIHETIAMKTSAQARELWTDRLRASWRKSRAFPRWVLAITAVVVIVCYTPLMWGVAAPLAIADRPQRADVIVVFAGGVGEAGTVGERYREQVLQAVALYKNDYAPQLFFVSGHTKTFREADIMRVLTESLGIPSTAVLTETQVSDTHDYVLWVIEAAKARGWHRILLMTSTYHSRRCRLLFARYAPELQVLFPTAPVSSYYTHRWGMRPSQLHGIVQEYIGIVYYWWRGWL